MEMCFDFSPEDDLKKLIAGAVVNLHLDVTDLAKQMREPVPPLEDFRESVELLVTDSIGFAMESQVGVGSQYDPDIMVGVFAHIFKKDGKRAEVGLTFCVPLTIGKGNFSYKPSVCEKDAEHGHESVMEHSADDPNPGDGKSERQ